MVLTPLHKSAINNSLKQGLSFALFRDKGSSSVSFICDDNSNKPTKSDLQFFAVKWLDKFADRTIISDRLSAEQAAVYKSDKKYQIIEPWLISTDYNHYMPSVRMLIDELKAEGGKTVISRVIAQTFTSEIATITEEYFNKNEAAYCCLLHTPKTGCWLIASPELLLSADICSKVIETVALAGTREINTLGEGQKEWDEKNITEQRIVKDYISQALSDLNVNFKVSQDVTIQTNNIEHLATKITGKINNTSEIEQIIDALNPTPALCGSPRDTAVKRIRSIEHHQRRLYGGYFGFSDKEQFKAIVTLRCAQLSNNNICIYAGGGITPDSIAQTEWDETTLKSQVLSNIITNEK